MTRLCDAASLWNDIAAASREGVEEYVEIVLSQCTQPDAADRIEAVLRRLPFGKVVDGLDFRDDFKSLSDDTKARSDVQFLRIVDGACLAYVFISGMAAPGDWEVVLGLWMPNCYPELSNQEVSTMALSGRLPVPACLASLSQTVVALQHAGGFSRIAVRLEGDHSEP